MKAIFRLKAWPGLLLAVLILCGCAATGEMPAARGAGVTVTCPVSGTGVRADDSAQMVEYKGKKYYFCCSSCKKEFEKDPEKYLGR